MNYEDFSPEAKAGIEQFRTFIRTIPKERIFSYDENGPHYIVLEKCITRLCYSLVIDACILHGASMRDAENACSFAKTKDYWTNK